MLIEARMSYRTEEYVPQKKRTSGIARGHQPPKAAFGVVRGTWLEPSKVPGYLGRMTKRSAFRYFKTSPEIIASR
jgi:hypothetical protein